MRRSCGTTYCPPNTPLVASKHGSSKRSAFSASNWPLLDSALREQHLMQAAETGPSDPLGQTFVVRAILRGPAGEAPVVSVWFVRTGEAFPRVVTAHPGGSK
jgi:hypothetical protein